MNIGLDDIKSIDVQSRYVLWSDIYAFSNTLKSDKQIHIALNFSLKFREAVRSSVEEFVKNGSDVGFIGINDGLFIYSDELNILIKVYSQSLDVLLDHFQEERQLKYFFPIRSAISHSQVAVSKEHSIIIGPAVYRAHSFESESYPFGLYVDSDLQNEFAKADYYVNENQQFEWFMEADYRPKYHQNHAFRRNMRQAVGYWSNNTQAFLNDDRLKKKVKSIEEQFIELFEIDGILF